jgi:3-oxoadipate enol-lactonase
MLFRSSLLCFVVASCKKQLNSQWCVQSKRSLHLKAVQRSSIVQERKLSLRDVDSTYRDVNYIDIGENKDPSLPPLVVLCGTAQTVNTYTQHLRALTASRRVIIPELRCQGSTQLLSEFGSMEQHCNDFINILDNLQLRTVDLVGFSFGGRVALTIAANRPSAVRRLSLTGVPLVRSNLGKSVLEGWREYLDNNNMKDCAWSFIMNGYSKEFIDRNQKSLATYVDLIIQGNPQPNRIRDLIKYSHVRDDDPLYSTQACVTRIACPTQVIAGTSDRIAGFQNTKDLSLAIPNSEFAELQAGHLVPFECPVDWRQRVLNFINTK